MPVAFGTLFAVLPRPDGLTDTADPLARVLGEELVPCGNDPCRIPSQPAHVGEGNGGCPGPSPAFRAATFP